MLQGVPPENIALEQIDQLFFAGLVATVASQEGSAIAGCDPGEIVAQAGEPGPERILDFAIRTGPWGDAYGARPDGLTLEHMKQAPNGIDRGALTPRLDEVLKTSSGRVELAPAYICADIPRLRERLSREPKGLVLVSRRHVRSNNSWMHNLPALMTGRDRCTLLIHPDDAIRRGLADGGLARIRSQAGSVEAPVEVSDEMLPGVVSLPHGWGHDKPGARLSVARERAGACNNVLAPGALLDVPSNNAAVNGIPVEVEAA
jgi:anaerobic selenocysteine-containing dehydrogenase